MIDITEENADDDVDECFDLESSLPENQNNDEKKSDDVDYSLVCEILNQANDELAMQGKRIYKIIPAPSPPNFTKCFRFDAEFLAQLLVKSRQIRSTEDANDATRKRRQGTYASGGKPAKFFKFDAGGQDTDISKDEGRKRKTVACDHGAAAVEPQAKRYLPDHSNQKDISCLLQDAGFDCMSYGKVVGLWEERTGETRYPRSYELVSTCKSELLHLFF